MGGASQPGPTHRVVKGGGNGPPPLNAGAPPGPLNKPQISPVKPKAPTSALVPAFPGDTIKSKDGNTYVVLDGKVRRKGDTAWRCNNPGNMTADKTVPEAWKYGAYRGKNLWGRFVIFPTLDAGWAGLKQWMEKREKMSVWNYAESHAPAKEKGNDPAKYARILIRHAFGTQGDAAQEQKAKNTTVRQLLDAGWPDKLKKAFNEAEGFHVGEELDFDDTTLPADVGPRVVLGRTHQIVASVLRAVGMPLPVLGVPFL